MIDIQAFRAVRPSRDKAYLVATRSYLTYSDEVLADKLAHNPYTFLHIINPATGRGLKPGPARYREVKKTFERFCDEDILRQDARPAYYLYRQVKEGNEYTGLVAAVAVEDYLEGRIKKHEKTLTRREKMFTDYLEVTGFNAEPVLLTYRDDLRINRIFARHIDARPEYEFTSTDRVLHQLWVINAPEELETITAAVGEQETLYIADGHHRCASSARLAQRLDEKGTPSDSPHRYFMALLIGEEQMKVYDYNRLVKDESGLSAREFMAALRQNFLVEPVEAGPFKPEKLHEISLYYRKNWYKLVPRTGRFDPRDPVDHLDAEIVNRQILKPILGIGDLKRDKRIGFLPGTEGMRGLQRAVDEGDYDLALGLYPVTVDQIRQVADAGKTMPPKSTYIEPKLRSGLTIYRTVN